MAHEPTLPRPGVLDCLLAGACAIGEVDEDEDDDHENDSCHSHHAGVSDVPRALRFEAGHGSNGGDERDENKPSEPAHINYQLPNGQPPIDNSQPASYSIR